MYDFIQLLCFHSVETFTKSFDSMLNAANHNYKKKTPVFRFFHKKVSFIQFYLSLLDTSRQSTWNKVLKSKETDFFMITRMWYTPDKTQYGIYYCYLKSNCNLWWENHQNQSLKCYSFFKWKDCASPISILLIPNLWGCWTA